MKKVISIIGLSALCMVSGAETINFTAGEGYSTGVLNDHADWNGSTNFTVDAAGSGTVFPSATVQTRQINYSHGVDSTATTLETSMQFRFTVTTAFYGGGARAVMGLQFEPSTNQTGLVSDDIRAFIRKRDAISYDLVINNFSSGGFEQFTAATFSDDLLGIFGGDEVTDLLELKLVLHRGGTETNWAADAILSNVDSNSIVSQTLGNLCDSTADYFNGALYGGIFSGDSNSVLSIENREVESFSVTNGNDAVIGFTLGEGYSSGVLNDRPEWNGDTNFTIDTHGGGTVSPDPVETDGQINHGHGIASDVDTLETSVRFRFTVGTGAYAAGARAVMGVQFEKGTNQTSLVSDDVRAFVLKTGVVTYQLVLNDLTDGLQQFKPPVFSDDLIGIFGGGQTTDLLELTLRLHRGATEADWTVDAILSNVDSNSIVSQILGNSINTPLSYFNSTLYGGLFSGDSDSDLQVSSREFESFTARASITALGYDEWAGGWGVELGEPTDDYDEDGLSNLYEYGLNGNPINALSQGVSPSFDIVDIGGGSNVFSYVHPQLAADQLSGLTYSLALKTDLILGSWVTNLGYTVTGTNVTGGTLDFVTNITSTVEDTKFIQLIIE